MKTPEEWHYIFAAQNYTILDIVREAQKEAYIEGQLAGLQMGKETALKTIEEVFSKPAERSESV